MIVNISSTIPSSYSIVYAQTYSYTSFTHHAVTFSLVVVGATVHFQIAIVNKGMNYSMLVAMIAS